MGRTLPSATQQILNEQDALGKFRRALRKEDQRAFDDLFRAARYHVAAIAYTSHLLPLEAMLLAMLLEEHKRVLKLEMMLTCHPEQSEMSFRESLEGATEKSRCVNEETRFLAAPRLEMTKGIE